jgi:hypothetical protein
VQVGAQTPAALQRHNPFLHPRFSLRFFHPVLTMQVQILRSLRVAMMLQGAQNGHASLRRSLRNAALDRNEFVQKGHSPDLHSVKRCVCGVQTKCRGAQNCDKQSYIVSQTHTHSSHSQTSRLFYSIFLPSRNKNPWHTPRQSFIKLSLYCFRMRRLWERAGRAILSLLVPRGVAFFYPSL